MNRPNPPLPQASVTALICNYNYGRYVHAAISSALNQTWRNVEVLVVDDGSTDDSREVIDSFGDRIRRIYKENGGQASAFNAGIAAARGEIICFLDSDDVWLPEKVEEVVRKFQSANWGLVCHELQAIHADGTPIAEEDLRYRPDSHLEEGTTLDDLMHRGYPWIFTPTSGMSLRTDIARKLLPIPERSWRICADNPLAYGSMCFAPTGVVRKRLGQYRHHDSNGFASLRHTGARYSVELTILQLKRHLYVLQVMQLQGQGKVDIAPSYPLFRSLCFMAARYPALRMSKIVRQSIVHYGRPGSDNQTHILAGMRRAIIDAVRSVLITLNLRPRFVEIREHYRTNRDKLDPDVLDFIQSTLKERHS